MDVFDELEQQFEVRERFPQLITIKTSDQEYRLKACERGQDFLTGLEQNQRVFLSLGAVEAMSQPVSQTSSLALSQALEEIQLPQRVLLNRKNRQVWWLGLYEGHLRFKDHLETFYLPIANLRNLVLVAVDN